MYLQNEELFLRQNTDKAKTTEVLEYLGRHIETPGILYLSGGASAVLIGWRERTVDIDCKFDPEPQGIYEALQSAKEKLDVNIELASPDHFIPPVPDWVERSIFIGQFGKLEVYHYDFYSQALAKIERGHKRDLLDVERMVEGGLIVRSEVGAYFQKIVPEILKYPSINQTAFEIKVNRFLNQGS